ncbi:hypothetical protein EL17_08750 [Anditalea andensis]|uniref:Adenylosuccinate synthetase n=1 Tax=Anditalea andensis TaxID=1048983 RepID=A0A074L2X3_9BACT|nr:hypothetical protein EL17_08750 [Anditalea andensis]
MRNIKLAGFLFFCTLFVKAQQPAPSPAADNELTDLFISYWPVVLLPIFMIVLWKFYRGRKRN